MRRRGGPNPGARRYAKQYGLRAQLGSSVRARAPRPSSCCSQEAVRREQLRAALRVRRRPEPLSLHFPADARLTCHRQPVSRKNTVIRLKTPPRKSRVAIERKQNSGLVGWQSAGCSAETNSRGSPRGQRRARNRSTATPRQHDQAHQGGPRPEAVPINPPARPPFGTFDD